MTTPQTDPRDTELGTTSPEKVAASQRRDAERWHDSYTRHTASALHARAVAAQNGHGLPQARLSRDL